MATRIVPSAVGMTTAPVNPPDPALTDRAGTTTGPPLTATTNRVSTTTTAPAVRVMQQTARVSAEVTPGVTGRVAHAGMVIPGQTARAATSETAANARADRRSGRATATIPTGTKWTGPLAHRVLHLAGTAPIRTGTKRVIRVPASTGTMGHVATNRVSNTMTGV